MSANLEEAEHLIAVEDCDEYPPSVPLEESYPPSFYCPISHQVMHDPVVLSDGHSYERRHIQRWIAVKETSPVTGAPLPDAKIMFPNHALRNAIEEYFKNVFSVHRTMIRKQAKKRRGSLTSNASLLRMVDSLMQISVLVNADLSAENVLRKIVNEAKELLGAEVASVFLVDAAKKELFSTINSTDGEIRIPITHGIAGHVASTGEPVNILDAYQDDRFNQAVDRETGFKTRNILCVPIKTKKGRVIGVANLINKAPGGAILSSGEDEAANTSDSSSSDGSETSKLFFSAEDQRFFVAYASQAAAAIANSGASFEPEPAAYPAEEAAKFSALARVAARHSQANKKKTAAAEEEEEEEWDEEVSSVSTPKEIDDLFDHWAEPEKGATDAEKATAANKADQEAEAAELTPSNLEEAMLEAAAKTEVPCGAVALATYPAASAAAAGVEALLKEAHSGWNTFDSLELDARTGGRALSTLGKSLVEQSGLCPGLGLDPACLGRFFVQVEAGYSSEHRGYSGFSGNGRKGGGKAAGVNNPYHNNAHAASVLHITHALLTRGGVGQALGQWHLAGGGGNPGLTHRAKSGQFESLALLVAAAAHDYQHGGLTNAYLSSARDPRALRYFDQRPNESHHVAASLALLEDPRKRCNFLAPMPRQEQAAFRKLVADLILATDMADHSRITADLLAAVTAQKAAAAQAAAPHSHSQGHGLDAPPSGDGGGGFLPGTEAEAVLALQVVIKAADLGHLALPWDQHLTWVKRLEEEFFAQGDMEKQLLPHLPVSFLMDREKPGVTKTQLGFFQFVVDPLFGTLGGAFPGAAPMVEAVNTNKEKWREFEPPVVAGDDGNE